MSKIETGRYSELLRKQLGQKGQELVAGELSPEISPVFGLEAALWSLEWYYLKGVRALSGSDIIGANVLAGGHMRLTNPIGSEVLATVTRVSMTAKSIVEWAVNLEETGAILKSVGLSTARDGRWPRTAALFQSALTISFTASSGAVPTGQGILHRGSAIADTLQSYSEQVVVPPGFALTWGSLTANVGVDLNVDWFERPVAALELS